ncbi:MAG: helix-turn-helix domain-containing protein, partial [Gemmatimonadaceae bacterium]
MDQRLAFAREHARGHWPMGVLCAQYGVSEKTGYQWVARFAAGGPAALADRSHATRHCPHRLDARLAAALFELRRQHPRWGPRKLAAYL